MKSTFLRTAIAFLSFLIPFRAYCQQQDTLAYQPKLTAFIIPAAFIGYGLVSLSDKSFVRDLDRTTKNELQEDHPQFAAHVDDYVQFAPAAAVYGLNLAGIKGKHSLADATGIYILSEAIMGGTVHTLKNITKRERPNGSGFNSFPSGHTANAFASAEFLRQEYKDVSPWYGYAGYTVATATGVLRMYNNRHWLSDVVAGAGFGILSTKVAYILYPKLKRLVLGKGEQHYNLVPTYQQHSVGLAFTGTF
jgi:membrane-associated phospholipid phosphatase